MHGKRATLLAASALAATAIVLSIVSVSVASGSKVVVHVIEHAVNDTVVDIGASGDSTGDLLTFQNAVFDEKDAKAVGSDLGSCIRVTPSKGSWQCTWTTFLADGQIVVSGPFYDTHDSVLAVLGGTGAFSGASGNMQLHCFVDHGLGKCDFIFRLNA